jgi:hypothetical protein
MAKAFSAKQYFQKLYSAPLLTEFYKQRDITALFEVTENTPRKNVVTAFVEFHESLDPEQKITAEEELSRAQMVSSKYSTYLLSLILKERKISEVTTIECTSEYDFVLYHYIFNKEVFEDLEFFSQFYAQKNYMLYEAGVVSLKDAEYATTELTREYTRISQKENSNIVCELSTKVINETLYVYGEFVEQATNDENDRRIVGIIKIAYLPNDKEVLISYSGKKYDKLIYLDTFLRIVCKSGYDAKEQSFSLTSFQQDDFDFGSHKNDVPLMTWKLKGLTLSFGNDKLRKKMKLTLPSSMHEYGLSPLKTTLEELALTSKWKEYSIDSVTLLFSFVHLQKGDKSVPTPCTVSYLRSSLCSLFPYDRYARSLLKSATIEKGFITVEKKVKEDVAKKWEV